MQGSVEKSSRDRNYGNVCVNVKQQPQRSDEISEMRWPGSGYCIRDEYRVYYFGEDGNHHRHEVAIIVTKDVSESVIDWVMRPHSNTINTNLRQVYAPTITCEKDELENFYTDLNRAIEKSGIMRLLC